MKYLSFLLGLTLMLSFNIFCLKNADITCTYRETIRKDVTQPVPTQSITYKNATDTDCCFEGDTNCETHLQKSAQKYCSRPDRVPKEYTFSSVKAMCGKGLVGGSKGIEYPAEE